MAVWENRVIYRYGDRFWENVWNVDVGAETDVPADVTTALETFAIQTLLDIFTVERIVRRPAGTTDEFIEVIVGAAGALAIGSQKVLPLWNTIKVLLQVGAGRPGIKFLRGILTGASVTDEQNHIDSGTVTLITGKLITLFNAVSDAGCNFVVGEDDKPAVSPAMSNTIQMRQQHRKRKKPAL
jgi:hypothetical protein